MAPPPPIPSPESIARADFDRLLVMYPAVVEAISAGKGGKSGQTPLVELDKYRYDTAPELFGSTVSERPMDLDAIKTLVEWKLRHGKFRPTLMSLVSSNSPKFAKDTVRDAIHLYRESVDRSKALGVLTKLKGIGPATASLLLTVHDPEHIIFFSDEAFYWLCLSGKKGPIKYNAKEYTALQSKASELSKRLGVSATDIEKVAYVLMRRSAEDPAAPADTNMSNETIVKPSAPKRKAATDVVTQSNVASARRSKRTRA